MSRFGWRIHELSGFEGTLKVGISIARWGRGKKPSFCRWFSRLPASCIGWPSCVLCRRRIQLFVTLLLFIMTTLCVLIRLESVSAWPNTIGDQKQLHLRWIVGFGIVRGIWIVRKQKFFRKASFSNCVKIYSMDPFGFWSVRTIWKCLSEQIARKSDINEGGGLWGGSPKKRP